MLTTDQLAHTEGAQDVTEKFTTLVQVKKMSTHLGPGITKQRATPPLTTSQVEPAEDKPPKK